jgi:O-antigen ligase
MVIPARATSIESAIVALIRILSLCIIGTIPLLFAAVQPWLWSFYSLGMIVVWSLGQWVCQPRPQRQRSGLIFAAMVMFFIWNLFMCLPIPHYTLSLVSSTRAEALSAGWALTGSLPAWESISYSAQRSLAWWLFLLSLLLFFKVVKNLCMDRSILKRIVFTVIGVGLLESFYGLLQALMPSMGVLWVDYIHDYLGMARGTFINRNNFAGFIEMVWPLSLGVTVAMAGRVNSVKAALGSDRLNRQALMALSIIVFLLALLFTRSRAGIVGGLVGLAVFSLTARIGLRSTAAYSRILVVGIIVLLCSYSTTIGVGSIVDRFLRISSDGHTRLEIWSDSLKIVKDHPLGVGLYNYEAVFPPYNRSTASDKTVVHAHNDYLQLLVESGWIGFLTLATGYLVFMGQCVRRMRHMDERRDPLRFYIAIGAFSGLISISVHSLFDFNLQIPANCLYFIVLMAILSACTEHSRIPATTPETRRTPIRQIAGKAALQQHLATLK